MGLSTFKVVAAGVASANFSGTEAEKAQLAKAYMRGEQRIPIKELHNYNSHHGGQKSAASICRILTASSDGHLHHATAWAVEKTMDAIAYVELGDQGDILYKLANKVTEHDRNTDNDGQVTVEEMQELFGQRRGSTLDSVNAESDLTSVVGFLTATVGPAIGRLDLKEGSNKAENSC